MTIGVSGAHTHDCQALIPLVKGIPPIRSRRGSRRRPYKLHADKGYDYNHLRRWISGRGIRHRIARKGIETSQRLGRHAPWPGSPDADVCTAATNAKPTISSPSPVAPAP